MKKSKRKEQKENIVTDNGLKTNYYVLMKSFVYGIEKNPIKVPAHVKEQMMIVCLHTLVQEVSKINLAEGVTSNGSKDL